MGQPTVQLRSCLNKRRRERLSRCITRVCLFLPLTRRPSLNPITVQVDHPEDSALLAGASVLHLLKRSPRRTEATSGSRVSLVLELPSLLICRTIHAHFSPERARFQG